LRVARCALRVARCAAAFSALSYLAWCARVGVRACAGDGNFHVILMVDPKSPRDLAEAKRLNSRMIERAIAMDGTCSGEHGVGIGEEARAPMRAHSFSAASPAECNAFAGKREYVVKELGADTVDAMRAIKLALDPQGLLNPGKVFELRRPS
jgi:D-lactate dehydrogenase (cytochrome)